MALAVVTAVMAGAWSQTHAQPLSRTLVSNLDEDAELEWYTTSASRPWLGNFDVEILNNFQTGNYAAGYEFHSVDLLLSRGPTCTDPDARAEVELWGGALQKITDLTNTGSEPGGDFEVRRFDLAGSAPIPLSRFRHYTIVVTTTSDQPECLRIGLTSALSSSHTFVRDYDDDSLNDWEVYNGIGIRKKNSNFFARTPGGRHTLRMRVNGTVNSTSTSLRDVIVRDAERGAVQTTIAGASEYHADLQPETDRVSIDARPSSSHATVRYLTSSGEEIVDAVPGTRRLDVDIAFGTTTLGIEVTAGDATTVSRYTLTLVRPEPPCDSPDLAGRRQIWTGVAAPAPIGDGTFGFAAATSLGTLSDTSFGIGAARRVVEAVTVASDGTLELRLDEPLDDATPSGLQLHVCDAGFTLQGETREHRWQGSGLDWSYAPIRRLRMSVPDDAVQGIDAADYRRANRLRVGPGWSGMNGPANFVWRYRVALEEGLDYRIEARGAGDETLRAFSEDGTPIATESGPGLAWASIEYTAERSADVLLSVSGARRIRVVDADTPHMLDEVAPHAGRTDCNDTIDTYHNCATSLGDARSGRIESATDYDVWGAVLAGGKTFEIEVHPYGRGGLTETRMEIFDYATKQKLAETTGTSGVVGTTIETPADTISTYHVRVSGVLAADGAGEYAILVSNEGSGPARLSVSDAEVQEAAGATLAFEVSLSPARAAPTRVAYASADGSALAGSDYTPVSGTLEFAAGETAKTIEVTVLDDAHDEGTETLSLTLSNAWGAEIRDGSGTGTINNTDPMPKAWMVRFGRTVASQVVDALTRRIDAGTDTHVTLGGIRLNGTPAPEPQAREQEPFGVPGWATKSERVEDAQDLAVGDRLLRSAFVLSNADAAGAGGPALTAWGRVATSGFEGDATGTTMDGRVTTGFVGFDAEWDRTLAGIMLTQSTGEGSYRMSSGTSSVNGAIESALTGVYPYAQLGLGARVSAWGVAGMGAGELTLEPAGANRMETDISMRMGAVGVKGKVLDGSGPSGLGVSLESDAMWVGTKSERTSELAAAEGDVTRLRLTAAGERVFEVGEDATFTPTAEVGLRHDGGDAETGTGLDVGAGVRYAAGPLTVEGQVRTLLAHEDSGFEEWGVSGAIHVASGGSGRGLALTIAPEWGSTSSAIDRMWSARDVNAIGAGSEFEAKGRVVAEVGFGLGLSENRGILTPYAGLTLGDAGNRAFRGGTRWQLGPNAALGIEATRQTATDGETAGELALRAAFRF